MKCGLEIHVQLDTDSKLFCDCRTNYQEAPPNHNICFVCLNQPGAKPYPPNKEALDGAIKIALMLACKISPDVTFSRGNTTITRTYRPDTRGPPYP